MQRLIQMKFGSHLYGTSTPASDLDLKSVHLPSAEEILLGRAKAVISTSTKADPSQKNTAEDIDDESFSLQQFLKLCAQGQTVAVDMLFAPEWAWLEAPHPIWRELVSGRRRLLTCKSASFVGYCRSQANKYGIRGSRVAAARKARDYLATWLQYEGALPLATLQADIQRMCLDHPHMDLIEIEGQAGKVWHWEVCNKKMPLPSSIRSAHGIMDRVVQEYGHRALQAEQNEGVDWKALSHAVRIANQAIELLSTGHVTFPRPEAGHLLAVKAGQLPYAEVGEEIDRLLVEVEEAEERSTLPASADQEWIDDLTSRAHRDVILRGKA